MKKGIVTKKAEFSPTKNSGLSLKDAKWISPTPKVLEINDSNTPNTERYLVIPKSAPQLQSSIRVHAWDVMNHLLTVSITESRTLFVLEWLNAVNNRRKVAEKSPFPDFEYDQLALIFLTGEGQRLVGLKLKGIQLMSHTTNFGTLNNLSHEVVFKYEETEKVTFAQEEKKFTQTGNDEADEEWSEVVLEPKTK
jgi:hypothetical protein